MSKILVMGGAGFIGYHLSKRLAEGDNEVVIATRVSPNQEDGEFAALLARPNVKIIKADLTDKLEWDKVGANYDCVYHLISINGFKKFLEIPHEVLRVGITSTLNALAWLQTKNNNPKAKILFTSSNEVYMGALEPFGPPPIPTPEDVPVVIPDTYNPRWSYGGQKLFSELLLIHYSKAYNLRSVIVRLHNIYGPRAGWSPMIPKIIERVKNRLDPFPIIDADENRSSCYVKNAIEGMIAAMESEKTDGGTYNIGDDRETTVMELVEKMFDIVGWRPKAFDIKNSPGSALLHTLPNISKLKKDTGWKPKFSIEEGLRETMAWYETYPKNS